MKAKLHEEVQARSADVQGDEGHGVVVLRAELLDFVVKRPVSGVGKTRAQNENERERERGWAWMSESQLSPALETASSAYFEKGQVVL